MTEILLATRFGPSSAAPAAVAAQLARRLDAKITVVYVASELEALDLAGGEAGVNPRDERERIMARIDDELRAFVGGHLPDQQVSVRVLEGIDVAEQVTRTAVELGAAYLIVGTRGRGQLARLILGDTTQSILQHTPCPVVVVPLHDEHGDAA